VGNAVVFQLRGAGPDAAGACAKAGLGARDHDYKRQRTTCFWALSLLDGRVIGDCMPRHRHQEFIRFLKQIDGTAPSALDLHLIVDNYGTTSTLGANMAAAASALPPALHPTSSSWLNLVERWFRDLTTQRLRRGSFDSVEELSRQFTRISTITTKTRESSCGVPLWIESSRRSPNVKKR